MAPGPALFAMTSRVEDLEEYKEKRCAEYNPFHFELVVPKENDFFSDQKVYPEEPALFSTRGTLYPKRQAPEPLRFDKNQIATPIGEHSDVVKVIASRFRKDFPYDCKGVTDNSWKRLSYYFDDLDVYHWGIEFLERVLLHIFQENAQLHNRLLRFAVHLVATDFHRSTELSSWGRAVWYYEEVAHYGGEFLEEMVKFMTHIPDMPEKLQGLANIYLLEERGNGEVKPMWFDNEFAQLNIARSNEANVGPEASCILAHEVAIPPGQTYHGSVNTKLSTDQVVVPHLELDSHAAKSGIDSKKSHHRRTSSASAMLKSMIAQSRAQDLQEESEVTKVMKTQSFIHQSRLDQVLKGERDRAARQKQNLDITSRSATHRRASPLIIPSAVAERNIENIQDEKDAGGIDRKSAPGQPGQFHVVAEGAELNTTQIPRKEAKKDGKKSQRQVLSSYQNSAPRDAQDDQSRASQDVRSRSVTERKLEQKRYDGKKRNVSEKQQKTNSKHVTNKVLPSKQDNVQTENQRDDSQNDDPQNKKNTGKRNKQDLKIDTSFNRRQKWKLISSEYIRFDENDNPIDDDPVNDTVVKDGRRQDNTERNASLAEAPQRAQPIPSVPLSRSTRRNDRSTSSQTVRNSSRQHALLEQARIDHLMQIQIEQMRRYDAEHPCNTDNPYPGYVTHPLNPTILLHAPTIIPSPGSYVPVPNEPGYLEWLRTVQGNRMNHLAQALPLMEPQGQPMVPQYNHNMVPTMQGMHPMPVPPHYQYPQAQQNTHQFNPAAGSFRPYHPLQQQYPINTYPHNGRRDNRRRYPDEMRRGEGRPQWRGPSHNGNGQFNNNRYASSNFSDNASQDNYGHPYPHHPGQVVPQPRPFPEHRYQAYAQSQAQQAFNQTVPNMYAGAPDVQPQAIAADDMDDDAATVVYTPDQIAAADHIDGNDAGMIEGAHTGEIETSTADQTEGAQADTDQINAATDHDAVTTNAHPSVGEQATSTGPAFLYPMVYPVQDNFSAVNVPVAEDSVSATQEEMAHEVDVEQKHLSPTDVEQNQPVNNDNQVEVQQNATVATEANVSPPLQTVPFFNQIEEVDRNLEVAPKGRRATGLDWAMDTSEDIPDVVYNYGSKSETRQSPEASTVQEVAEQKSETPHTSATSNKASSTKSNEATEDESGRLTWAQKATRPETHDESQPNAAFAATSTPSGTEGPVHQGDRPWGPSSQTGNQPSKPAPPNTNQVRQYGVDYDDKFKLYVAGVGLDNSKAIKIFEPYGPIHIAETRPCKAYLNPGRAPKPDGMHFTFVTFNSVEACEAAKSALSGQENEGVYLKINTAYERSGFEHLLNARRNILPQGQGRYGRHPYTGQQPSSKHKAPSMNAVADTKSFWTHIKKQGTIPKPAKSAKSSIRTDNTFEALSNLPDTIESKDTDISKVEAKASDVTASDPKAKDTADVVTKTSDPTMSNITTKTSQRQWSQKVKPSAASSQQQADAGRTKKEKKKPHQKARSQQLDVVVEKSVDKKSNANAAEVNLKAHAGEDSSRQTTGVNSPKSSIGSTSVKFTPSTTRGTSPARSERQLDNVTNLDHTASKTTTGRHHVSNIQAGLEAASEKLTKGNAEQDKNDNTAQDKPSSDKPKPKSQRRVKSRNQQKSISRAMNKENDAAGPSSLLPSNTDGKDEVVTNENVKEPERVLDSGVRKPTQAADIKASATYPQRNKVDVPEWETEGRDEDTAQVDGEYREHNPQFLQFGRRRSKSFGLGREYSVLRETIESIDCLSFSSQAASSNVLGMLTRNKATASTTTVPESPSKPLQKLVIKTEDFPSLSEVTSPKPGSAGSKAGITSPSSMLWGKSKSPVDEKETQNTGWDAAVSLKLVSRGSKNRQGKDKRSDSAGSDTSGDSKTEKDKDVLDKGNSGEDTGGSPADNARASPSVENQHSG